MWTWPGGALASRPKPTPTAPHAALQVALGAGQAPRSATHEGRVQMFGELVNALWEGRLPSREVCVWFGGAGRAWLANGGNLQRKYLQLVKPKSHHTAQWVWRKLQEGEEENRVISNEGTSGKFP